MNPLKHSNYLSVISDPSLTSGLDVLIKTMGSAGIAVAAAWLMFRSYTASVEKKDKVFEARVNSLEKASEECIRDREKLHAEMHLLTKTVLERNTVVIAENNEVIQKNSEMIEKIADFG